MLTSDQFDVLVVPIDDLYNEYADTVIRDISRRLSGLDMTSSAAWQLQRLTESGQVFDNALREIAKLTGRGEEELKLAFKRAGVQAMEFDDSIYRAAGLDPLPLNLSPQMQRVLVAGYNKTGGIMSNLTLTTASSAQESFIKSADLAYLQVTTGAKDYDSAIRSAIKDVSSRGLTTISFPSGRSDQIDVAMRRTLLTGIGQTTGKPQEARADEMGQDLVQVSEHIGARPSHAEWQGGIYSRSGKSDKYPDFVSSTGYGTGAGLGGWLCRHSWYPFFKGISKNAYDKVQSEVDAGKTVSYNGKDLLVYEATQQQRYIERNIRKWKRQASALQAGKLDNTKELFKVREWQARARDFVDQTGLRRQYVRESIGGLPIEKIEMPKAPTPPAP